MPVGQPYRHEAHGALMTSFHLLMGNVPLPTLLNVPSRHPPPDTNLPYQSLTLLPQWHLGPCPNSNGNTLPSHAVSLPSLEAASRVASEEPPCSKRRDEMLLHKVLTGSQWEAFARDSDLVWMAREDYFKTNHPHFDYKTTCDLMDIFQDMVTSTDLLGSQIYEIQEVWGGKSELQYVNNTLKTLPKGLQFFCPISPLELPKVMGLAGIHNPGALHCFNGMTFCPWCRKEGQNEGTIVNHLQVTHYRQGLVCGTCFPCPSATSKAIQCHG